MGKKQAPTVFVSSTCYDLAQIRRDIGDFIEGFGFCPMLSEHNSFPVDPLAGTIENCRRNVREQADILVLVVGTRYGSVDRTGRSITNTEYLEARAKGIPTYSFVAREMLTHLPVWKANPGATFPCVDSIQLFEFVDTLHKGGSNWVFPFESASDIVSTLRKQWGYLLGDALALWTKAQPARLSATLCNLTGKGLRLAIERPFAWEYRLFSCVLEEGLKRCQGLRADFLHDLTLANLQCLDPSDLFTWIANQFPTVMRICRVIEEILNDYLPDAFGAEGEPGDPEKIVYGATKVVEAYKAALEWGTRFQSVHAGEDYRRLLSLHARLIGDMVGGIEKFSSNMAGEMQNLVDDPPTPGSPREITITLRIALPEGLLAEIDEEFRRLAEYLGLPYCPS